MTMTVERQFELQNEFNKINSKHGTLDAREFLIDEIRKLEREVAWRKEAIKEVTVIRCRDCGISEAGWVYNPCPHCHGLVERRLL